MHIESEISFDKVHDRIIGFAENLKVNADQAVLANKMLCFYLTSAIQKVQVSRGFFLRPGYNCRATL